MRVFLFCCTLAILLTGCTAMNQGQYDGIERGWMERSDFDKPALAEFKTNYDTATVAPEMVSMLNQVKDDVEALIFLGTWCPDSKHQVPRFLKIADLCGIPAVRVRLYGLDRTKKSPDGLTDQYVITRIPTFIFLKGGKEIGRITEFPETTLEGDMLTTLVAAQGK